MSIVIIILLVLGGIIGYRRGLTLQALHMLGTLSAVIIAALNFELLATRFDMILPYPAPGDESMTTALPDLVDPELSFYKMGAFIMIFFLAKIIMQLIVSAFDYLQQVPILGLIGSIIAAAVGVAEFIVMIVIVLFMIALVPIEFVQDAVDGGLFRQFIDNTFVLSGQLKSWIN